MNRPTGLISDVPSDDDLLIGSLIGSSPRQCDKSWLVDYFRYDLDQWPNQTCVAFSMVNCIWAAQGIAGVPENQRVLLSPPILYYYTLRRTHGAKAVLADAGSKPSQAVAVMQELGCCAWADWPHEPDKPGKCLSEPPGNLMMAATDADWIKLYRHDGYGLTRKEQIIGAFCSDVPQSVLCGIAVDEAYCDLKGDPWPGRTGPLKGRHMISLCGHNEIGPYVATSWGPGWAIGGLGQITWEAVMSLETTDVISVAVDVSKMPKKSTA